MYAFVAATAPLTDIVATPAPPFATRSEAGITAPAATFTVKSPPPIVTYASSSASGTPAVHLVASPQSPETGAFQLVLLALTAVSSPVPSIQPAAVAPL